MEKQFFTEVIAKFDEYVQNTMKSKTLPPAAFVQQTNKLHHYDQQMEKKLKIKTVPKFTQFQKLLAPMKDLNSFISIKQVLQNLGGELMKKSERLLKAPLDTKELYVDPSQLRGVEMQRIEQHLRNKQYWQRRYNNYTLTEDVLGENDFKESDYKQWMEDTLQKLSTKGKQDCGFNKKLKIIQNHQKNHIYDNIRNQSYFQNNNFIPRQKLQQNVQNQTFNQHSQAFSKLSDVLTARLRRILKKKTMAKTSRTTVTTQNTRTVVTNQNSRTIVTNSNTKEIKRKIIRTPLKGTAKISKENGNPFGYNPKTSSQIIRSGDQWRNKINQRLKFIMTEEGWSDSKYNTIETRGQQSSSGHWHKFK